MNWRTVDMSRESRRDQFAYFQTLSNPYVGVTVQVDVTELAVCAAAGRVNRSSRAARSILAIVAVWLTDANLTNKPVRQAVSRNCLRGGARFVPGDRPGSPGCPSCKACSVRPVKLVAPALQGLWLPPSKTCDARPVENGGRPPANKTRALRDCGRRV